MNRSSINRRQFLVGSATVAGGLTLGISLTSEAALPNARKGALQPNAWLQITPENEVIFQLDKTEMGQGVYTSLTAIIAEELEVDPRDIKIQLAQVHRDSQDPMQITGGSTSVATRWLVLRETGAQARMMLVGAAARYWGIKDTDCYAEQGKVHRRGTGDSFTYGELAAAASKQRKPSRVPLKDPADFKVIGKSMRRLDSVAKCTGKTQFGIDVQVSGAVNAIVMRNPHFGGAINNFDDSAARKANGVIDVFEIEAGIAVVADTYWHARQASKLIEVDWDKGSMAGVSSDSIRRDWVKKAEQKGRSIRKDGKGLAGLKDADRVVESIYEVPYLAHATMEPQNATASFSDGRCEVWAPNQAPDLTQAFVAEALGIRRKHVIVHTTMMGGGFGRRAIADFAVDAALISRETGRPVKVLWSREDDIQHDYYRPATYNVLKAGLDKSGRVHTWYHKIIAPSLVASLLPRFADYAPEWMPGWLVGSLIRGTTSLTKTRDPTTSEGAAHHKYAIDNINVRHVYHDPGVPLGFWRSVGHSQNAFVTESFIDELAHEAGEDPLQFRKRLLSASPRHLAVLELVARRAGWGQTPAGVNQGIAVHESFGSVVAEVVELVSVNGALKISRVVCAVDCGLAVNPDLVKAQMESGIVFGLTAALKGEITIRDGAVEQSNFHDYQMLRMFESPKIEVFIVQSTNDPTGVGEPGTPPIAPALANAIFAATGNRHRTLPIELV